MNDKLLIVYLSIGDEDGPSFSCLLVDFNDYKDIIPKSNAIIVINDGNFVMSKAKYMNCNSNSFKSLFCNFRIVNILEIHDWYDYLSKEQVIQKQQNIYNNYFIPDYYEPLSFIIVIPYNQDPIKYLIPHNSAVYRYISSNLNIFSESDKHEEKQNLANIMRPYIVNASYYQIMKRIGMFVEHNVVLSDEIEDNDQIKFR